MIGKSNLSLPQLSSQFYHLIKHIRSLPKSSQRNLLKYFILVLSLKLVLELFIYFSSKQTSKIYSTLTDKENRGQFIQVIGLNFVLILGISGFKSLVEYLRDRWIIIFRKYLSLEFLKLYCHNDNLIKINDITDVDNPDQRLTEELDFYCEKLIKLVTKLIISPILIVYYTIKCMELSNYSGVLGIFAWFVIGSIVSYHLIYKVSIRLRIVEQSKSNYRKEQIELNQNLELIQTYNSFNYHYIGLISNFMNLINNQYLLIFQNFLLKVNLNLMDYSGSIITYCIISIPILFGYFDDKSASELSGLISLNSFLCMYLIFQLTTLIDQSETLSQWLGHSIRLNELINQLNPTEKDQIELDDNFDLNDSPIEINLININLINFKHEVVFQDFNLNVQNKENWCIIGPNGSGKSSIAKLISGRIQPTSGHIIRNGLSDPNSIMYFNHKLMIIDGSLLDQICYPNSFDSYFNSSFDLSNTDDIIKLLELANLQDQFNVNDFNVPLTKIQWYNKYSLGTLTKLNLIRVFLIQPKLIILDETTQTLDNISEFKLLSNLTQFNIQWILISHKSNFNQFDLDQLKLLDLNNK